MLKLNQASFNKMTPSSKII